MQYKVFWNETSRITWELESCLRTEHAQLFQSLDFNSIVNKTNDAGAYFPEIFGENCILPLIPKKKDPKEAKALIGKDADSKKRIKLSDPKEASETKKSEENRLTSSEEEEEEVEEEEEEEEEESSEDLQDGSFYIVEKIIDKKIIRVT